jgi:hypothetical protein
MSAIAQKSEPTPEAKSGQHAGPLRVAIPALFVAIPPIFFFTVLVRNALNIPIYDDYDALLNFLNQLTQLNSMSAKVSYFFASQHGEIKLFLLHGLTCLQVYFLGHIDFLTLSAVGNGFIFLLGILLWKMFLPDCKDLATRLAYFVPVSWLLFQLQYWMNLDFATPGLQHIAVLPFAFGTIYMLVRGRGPWAFCFALLFLILAIASDGNGFFLIPIGVTILVLGRQYKRVAAWLLVSAGCIAAYAYHFNMMSSQTGHHRSIISAFHPLAPAYMLAFIGSAASFPFKACSFVLGVLLCVFFFYLARRGYMRRNPLVSYCVLFVLITAVGVAGIRSDFGIAEAFSSRYTMYSALLLIFAWFAIVEEFLQHRPASIFHNDIFLFAVLVVVPLSLSMDFGGWLQLGRRHDALVQAMAGYEHPTSTDSQTGPSPPLLTVPTDPTTDDFNRRVRIILEESIRLGVYRPPPM